MTDTASRRINMRISEPNLELIKDAADANGQDMTSFVLGAALESARRVVRDLYVTRLAPADWDRLIALIEDDTAPEPNPTLERALRAAEENAVATGIPIDASNVPHLPASWFHDDRPQGSR